MADGSLRHGYSLLPACLRVEEILRVTTTVYEKPRAMLYWEKTKNGRPHSIPLPPQAVVLLDGIPLNRHGVYFPHERDPSLPTSGSSLPRIVKLFLRYRTSSRRICDGPGRRSPATPASRRKAGTGYSTTPRAMSRAGTMTATTTSPRSAPRWRSGRPYLELVLAGEITEIGQRDAVVVAVGRGAAA
jgi:integrase